MRKQKSVILPFGKMTLCNSDTMFVFRTGYCSFILTGFGGNVNEKVSFFLLRLFDEKFHRIQNAFLVFWGQPLETFGQL